MSFGVNRSSIKMSRVSEEEIVQYLREIFGVTVTAEQLSKPTTNFVLDVYSHFLTEFGCGPLNQPDLMACEGITRLGDMDGFFYPANVWRALSPYVNRDSNQVLTLNDILQPKRARTLEILRILCRFHIRFMKVKQEWIEIEKAKKHIPERIEALSGENHELSQQIEEKSMLLSSLQKKSVTLEKELAASLQANESKKAKSEEAAQRYRKIKAELLKKRDELAEVEVETCKQRDRAKELEEMIVQSPQKVISATAEMERELAALKLEADQKETEKSRLAQKLKCQEALFAALTASATELANLLTMLNETDNQCVNLDGIKQESATLQQQIRETEIELQENDENLKAWRAKRAISAAKFARDHANKQRLLDGLRESGEQRKQRACDLQRSIDDAERRRESLQRKSEQIDARFRSLMARFRVARDEFTQAYADNL